MQPLLTSTREQILEQLRDLGPMAYGTLTPVFRGDPEVPTYFKLQVWKDGRNQTRHVKAEELPELQMRIGNRIQAEDLFEQFVRLAAEPASRVAYDVKKKRK
jgi:hypothetical protein